MALTKVKPVEQKIVDTLSQAVASADQKAETNRQGVTTLEPPRQERPLSKDDYWRRREERDLATQHHIRRSGLWQAVIQSQGILSFANSQNLDEFLAAVDKAAEHGVKFVEQK